MVWESSLFPLANILAHKIKLDKLFIASSHSSSSFSSCKDLSKQKPLLQHGKDSDSTEGSVEQQGNLRSHPLRLQSLFSLYMLEYSSVLLPTSTIGITYLFVTVEFCSFSTSSLCCRATICLERSSGVLWN